MEFKRYFITIGATIIFCLTLFPTIIGISQWAETRYFPVITELQYVRAEATPENKVVVWGKTTKIRDCVFENIAFYKKTRWGDEMVSSERLIPRQTLSAPVGEYDFGPYEVNMNLNELESTSSIRFLHDCHPVYLTESVVLDRGRLN